MILRRILIAILLLGVARADEVTPPEEPITEENREHWSFLPLAGVTPPAVTNTAWCRTPIDRFILKELEDRELAPMPEADRATLLRRVTFDLTGLPPTPEELDAFLFDTSDDAFERVVDRLLLSPAYAERWAQHWLDVARYAETDGFELDQVRQNAWRYRDWVIDALAADTPYQEFLQLQIAGDLLRPNDPDAATATGFLLCGPDMPDINLQEERRHNFLNDMTSTVGQVCLGLQMGCASCHDHKFDPISQYDFYRLRAFFEPCDLFKDQAVATPEEVAAIEKFELDRAEQWAAIEKERSSLMSDRVANATRIEELKDELSALKKTPPPEVTMVRAIHRNDNAAHSRLWVRGDFRRAGPEVEPAFPRVVTAAGVESTIDEEGDSRVALAKWLTSPDNALAGRVIVNRLWQSHFGRGICDTPNDLGFMGGAASHPELMDWLTAELHRNGGSLKAMHRLMVTSAVYCTASRSVDNAPQWSKLLEKDESNKWLGRMRRQRLDGESVRDSLLLLSGELNLEQGGPGIRPPLPPEVVMTLLKDQWTVTPDPGQHARRSIYLFVRRNLRFPLFDVFDRPDTNQSCPQRHESTTAPQALTLLNSGFTWDSAEKLAERVREQAGSDPRQQIETAVRLILSRSATPEDQELAEGADLATYCAALLNSSEFLYVD